MEEKVVLNTFKKKKYLKDCSTVIVLDDLNNKIETK